MADAFIAEAAQCMMVTAANEYEHPFFNACQRFRRADHDAFQVVFSLQTHCHPAVALGSLLTVRFEKITSVTMLVK